MDDSLRRISQFEIELVGQHHLCAVIASEIHGLRTSIMNQAGELKFVFVPPILTCFFEKEALFGPNVFDAFPSARPEIKDAGNCLVLGLHNASVFHLMRAAEHGLRALAAHLKIKIKHQLEYAGWGAIIRGIDKKLTALQPKARGKKKSEDLEFYRVMMSECNTLKDVWRNNVMHTRGRYNEPEALGVYTHVSEFMERLAKKVSAVG
jgi:hypothetical protein